MQGRIEWGRRRPQIGGKIFFVLSAASVLKGRLSAEECEWYNGGASTQASPFLIQGCVNYVWTFKMVDDQAQESC